VQLAIGPDSAPQTILTADAIEFNDGKVIEALANPDGSANTETRVTVDRMLVNNVDMNTTVTTSEIVGAESLIDKPICTVDTNGDPLVPAIYVSPAAYADSKGRSVSGVRAFAQTESSSPNQWRVRMISFVSQDYCDATPTGGAIFPIDPSGPLYSNGAPNDSKCSVYDGAGNRTLDRSDGVVDVYEVRADFGTINVQTRCIAP
jgi:hypothetical protein